MSDPAPAISGSATQPTAPSPEVVAIGKVDEALSGLEPAIQHRVLRWAADRFGLVLAKPKPAPTDDDDEDTDDIDDNGTYADFAALYDAANPSTEADKALVAGYWLQVLQSNTEWTGFSANKVLNNLGHGVKNITIALSALIDSTPRLVMQTHKAGKTKQARKKYKVTGEGIKRVKQMLAGNGGQE